MKASLLMLPQQNSDLHSTLFNMLRQLGIKDFLPNNVDRKRIVFHSNGKFIVARLSEPLDQAVVPLIEENLDVQNSDHITAIVTLNRDRQIMISPEERKLFQERFNRLPKSSESHKYIRMTDDDLIEYVPKLLEKAGLKVGELKITESPLPKITMKKRGFYYKPVDISFSAEIIDITAFSKAWYEGIGRTKTYGFGMIRAVKV